MPKNRLHIPAPVKWSLFLEPKFSRALPTPCRAQTNFLAGESPCLNNNPRVRISRTGSITEVLGIYYKIVCVLTPGCRIPTLIITSVIQFSIETIRHFEDLSHIISLRKDQFILAAPRRPTTPAYISHASCAEPGWRIHVFSMERIRFSSFCMLSKSHLAYLHRSCL